MDANSSYKLGHSISNLWSIKLKQLLTSKKFIVMVAGLLVAFAARYGLNLDETEVAGILAVVIAYLFTQGQADKGKEAAKVQAIATVVDTQNKTSADQIAAIKNV